MSSEKSVMRYDKIIIGGGIFGLYALNKCAADGQSVLLLEYDDTPFGRASYINQARVHNGYHYPRSLSTAEKSAKYFHRFDEVYGFSFHKSFKKIYATSSRFSMANAQAFKRFCARADIPCTAIDASLYFREGMVDGAFETEEYTIDAQVLKQYFIEELTRYPKATIAYGARIQAIKNTGQVYELTVGGQRYETPYVLNATYGSINQLQSLANLPKFDIKYELCEMILCDVGPELREVGITVMDGPFFSIMPFGQSGLHSLSSVRYTPHVTSHDALPTFPCQAHHVSCSSKQLDNCNTCALQPKTNWVQMRQSARLYLQPHLSFNYVRSLFAVKAILSSAEINDARPTVIRQFSEGPKFYAVLSGKLNTIFDLDLIL